MKSQYATTFMWYIFLIVAQKAVIRIIGFRVIIEPKYITWSTGKDDIGCKWVRSEE